MTPGAKRVLIVDDDQNIRTLLAEQLGQEYEVETAANGSQAFASVMRTRPDVILLDINLPGMSGLDVLKAIRQIDSALPILVITGNETVTVAEEAMKNGAYAYLPKPFDLRYLEHLLAVIVGSGSRTR